MVYSSTDINTRKEYGMACFAETIYQRTAKELYQIQFSLKNQTAEKLMLLLYVLENWLNTYGAANIITERQLTCIMDKIVMVQKECACKSIQESAEEDGGIRYLATEDFAGITTEDGLLISI